MRPEPAPTELRERRGGPANRIRAQEQIRALIASVYGLPPNTIGFHTIIKLNNFVLKNRTIPPMIKIYAESPMLVVSVTTGQVEPGLAGFHK